MVNPAPHPPVLQLRDLCVAVGHRPLLQQLCLRVEAGERLAVVGGSGAGKSLLAQAVMGLLRPPLQVQGGAIELDGVDLLTRPPRERHRLRGTGTFLIFQSPGALLDPLLSIRRQLQQAAARAGRSVADIEAALRGVGLPERVAAQRAHQLSGGMKQRVLITMALLLRPRLVIADEPTSSLDPDTAEGVLSALDEMQLATGCALLLITHDLRIVGRHADHVLVLERGQVQEQGLVARFMARPESEAGAALLRAARALEAQP
jgi:ABC-type glutathione transport system ATPase component